MKIISTEIRNIRNIEHLKIDLNNKTLIYGKNGSGKTSILESLYLSITGKSFRTSNISDSIKTGEKYSFIESVVEDIDNYERTLSFGFNRNDKVYKIDGEHVKRRELISIIPSVVFTPDTLDIIKGGPSLRRNFLDRIAFIIDKNYYYTYVYYKKYLKNKQKLIYDKNRHMINILNKSVYEHIEKIRNIRKSIIENLNKIINEISEELNFNYNVEFSFNYKNNNIINDLDSILDKEIYYGKVIYGPHIDNINVKINSRKSYNASMGELYFLSFLLKVSELSFYTKYNIFPVFICDDVFNFLDKDNSGRVIDIINKIKNQIIITSPHNIDNNNINNISINKIL